jgi:hypothetical protein
MLALLLVLLLAEPPFLRTDKAKAYILRSPRRQIMKLLLIAIGLLATTGAVYAACIFC